MKRDTIRTVIAYGLTVAVIAVVAIAALHHVTSYSSAHPTAAAQADHARRTVSCYGADANGPAVQAEASTLSTCKSFVGKFAYTSSQASVQVYPGTAPLSGGTACVVSGNGIIARLGADASAISGQLPADGYAVS